MINVLLCDDNEEMLKQIKDYIDSIRSEIRYPINIASYMKAEDVLKRLLSAAENNDILIADIDMPVLSGMELAQIIRDANLDIILIFMTAHAECVFNSFEYSPSYNVKP